MRRLFALVRHGLCWIGIHGPVEIEMTGPGGWVHCLRCGATFGVMD